MASARLHWILLLTVVVNSALAAAPAGQNNPWPDWELARHSNSVPGLSLTISTTQTEYFIGERIPVLFTYMNAASTPVYCETRNYDRSGRLDDMQWMAVSDNGEAATDPIHGMTGGIAGGISSGPKPISNGESYKEIFEANEWLWFGKSGDYSIAVVSTRVRVPESNESPWGGSQVPVASNKLRLHIREQKPGEVEHLASRLAEEITTGCAEENRNRYLPTLREAGRQLRFLHALIAVPYYLRYRDCSEVSFSMRAGLLNVPDTTAALNALRSELQKPDVPVSASDTWLYGRLYVRCMGETSQSRFGQTPRQALDELQQFAEAKQGKILAESLAALGSNTRSTTEALRLAKLLPDIPAANRPQAIATISRALGKDAIPFLEPQAEDADKNVASYALGELIRLGSQRHLDIVLDDLESPHPDYSVVSLSASELKLPISEGRQLSLARALAAHPERDPWRIASLLAECATTTAIVESLQSALVWATPEADQNARGHILQALARVAPEVARPLVLEHLKPDHTYASQSQELFKMYARDPEFHQLAVSLLKSGEHPSALEALMESATTDTIPLLLERIHARTRNPFSGQERNILEKATGHLLARTPNVDYSSPQQQLQAVSEWERWWALAQNWDEEKRRASNVEQAIKFLEVATVQGPSPNPAGWQFYHQHLVKLAQKDPSELTTKTLQQCWNDPKLSEQLRQDVLKAWKQEHEKH